MFFRHLGQYPNRRLRSGMNVFSNYSRLEVRIISTCQFQLWLANTEVLRRASIYFVQPVEKTRAKSMKDKMTLSSDAEIIFDKWISERS